MLTRKKEIPINIQHEIVDLYINKKLSQTKISTMLHMASTTIKVVLVQHNIILRNQAVVIDKQKLLNLYIDKQTSVLKLAKIFNCGQATIKRRLNLYHITIRTIQEARRLWSKNPNINKEKILDLYINHKYSAYKCAEILKCSTSMIVKYLHKNHIKTRTRSEARKLLDFPMIKKINKDELYDYYVVQKLSIPKCAKIFKCCFATIQKRLAKYNIEGRNIDSQVLIAYTTKNYSVNQCALLFECSRKKIYNCLKNNNIAIRSSKGYKRSEETKIKMRLSKINNIKNKTGQMAPGYNPIACRFFDYLNKNLGLNGMHAENGGEFHIKELGYWVDYYEPDLNLVVEWDEIRHNLKKMIKKDTQRQQAITKKLGCVFLRIKEEDMNFSLEDKQCLLKIA